MNLASLGEFGMIEAIRGGFPSPEGVVGIGDDCAVIPQQSGFDTLVSTDMLMEGSHFLIEDVSPFQLGWKSAAVNFSDIAAMGGRPVGSFLAFALPKNLQERYPEGDWVAEFMRGYGEISRRYGFPLLGGDTTSSPDRVSVCVTVLGQAVHGQAKCRSNALPGDLICVTGPLGDSAAGLDIVLRRCSPSSDVSEGGMLEIEKTLVERHYMPLPQMEKGMALADLPGVHAMMDISDGLGSDLIHIMDESGVGAELDVRLIPLSDELRAYADARGLDPLKLAISGGEDYELLFTINPESEKKLTIAHSVVGRITPDADGVIHFLGTDKTYTGFHHF